MINPDAWTPSKFVMRNGKLTGSRDPNELFVASRLAADKIAALYTQLLPKYARGRLLDLGCGKAPLFGAYRPWVDEVICADWKPLPHVDVVIDLAADLPFHDSRFDTILLSDVLEHVPTPERVWREMTRILAPGGRIIVNVPFIYQLHEEPHDYYRYTEFALQRFVRENALELRDLIRTGGAIEVVTDIFAKHVMALPLFGKWTAELAQATVSRVLRTRLVARAAERSSRRFPFGYFVVAEKPVVAASTRW